MPATGPAEMSPSGEHAENGARLLDRRALGDLAHELRSPLGGITAMIEILSSSPLDSNQRRYVEGLRAAAQHLHAIADSILKADRVADGGPVPLQAAKGGFAEDSLKPLEEVLLPILAAAEARARVRGLTFEPPALAGALGSALVPGRALRQMLENLIDNAVRLTESGTIALLVQEDRDGGLLRLAVRDEGPGLTPESAAGLFRRGSTLPDRSRGAGLGLAIVAELVDHHSGRCGAGPRPDGVPGAELWVALPLRPLHPPTDRSERRPRILIVDDHAASRFVLATILSHLGAAPVSEEDPGRALAALAREPFDAVLTDLVMPAMLGFDFVRAIRGLPALAADFPVIVVSGRVGLEDQRRAERSGATVFIEKPVSIRAIAAALAQVGLPVSPTVNLQT